LTKVSTAMRSAVAAHPDQQAAEAAAQTAPATVHETRSDRAAAARAGIPRVV
jgi:hypothetical protein